MLLHPNLKLAASDVDSLFPRDTTATLKAEEALHSHMIIGFEEAIANGMLPLQALGHVLSWVASEMARFQTEQYTQGAPDPSAKAWGESAEDA